VKLQDSDPLLFCQGIPEGKHLLLRWIGGEHHSEIRFDLIESLFRYHLTNLALHHQAGLTRRFDLVLRAVLELAGTSR
jgi:hypothetical protein